MYDYHHKTVLSVFLILGIIDDDFFRVEHALSAMTLLGIILGITLSIVPDDFFGKINNINEKYYHKS